MRARIALRFVTAVTACILCNVCPAAQDVPGLDSAFPPETIVYVRCGGSPGLRDAYLKTALGKISQLPQMQVFLRRLQSTIIDRKRSSMANQDVDLTPLEHLRIRRLAIGFIGLSDPPLGEVPVQQGMPIDAAAVVDARKGLKAVVQLLRNDIAANEPQMKLRDVTYKGKQFTSAMFGQVQVYWHLDGNRLVLATSARRGVKMLAALSEPPTPSLADSPSYKKGVEAIGRHAPVMGHLNVQKMLTIGGMFAQDEAKNALQALGVTGVRSVSFGLAYAGEGVRSTLFIQAPEPRRGLVSVLATGPAAPPKALELIPADVAFAFAGKLKPDAVLKRITEAIAVLSPDTLDDFEDAFRQADGFLGFNLRTELLAALGPETAFWMANNGTPVIAFEVNDPELLDTCLRRLKANAPRLRVKTTAAGDRQIEYVTAPGVPIPFAPSYLRYGKYLLVSFAPHMLRDALDRFDDKAPLLKDTPGFKRATAGLPTDAASVGYADTLQSNARWYNWAAMFVHVMNGMREVGEVPKLPFGELPSAYAVFKHMFPSGYARTISPEGITYRVFSPTGLVFGTPPASIGSVSILAGMLLPALSTSRELARQLQCKNNLRQIGIACVLYIDEKGRHRFYPNKLEDLLTQGVVAERSLFICPCSRDVPRPDAFVCSYESILDLTEKRLTATTIPSDMPLAWDKRGNHRSGRCVVYADSHVDFLDEERFQKEYARMMKWLKQYNNK